MLCCPTLTLRLRQQDAKLSHQEGVLRQQNAMLSDQKSVLRQQDAKLSRQESDLRQQDAKSVLLSMLSSKSCLKGFAGGILSSVSMGCLVA